MSLFISVYQIIVTRKVNRKLKFTSNLYLFSPKSNIILKYLSNDYFEDRILCGVKNERKYLTWVLIYKDRQLYFKVELDLIFSLIKMTV